MKASRAPTGENTSLSFTCFAHHDEANIAHCVNRQRQASLTHGKVVCGTVESGLLLVGPYHEHRTDTREAIYGCNSCQMLLLVRERERLCFHVSKIGVNALFPSSFTRDKCARKSFRTVGKVTVNREICELTLQ